MHVNDHVFIAATLVACTIHLSKHAHWPGPFSCRPSWFYCHSFDTLVFAEAYDSRIPKTSREESKQKKVRKKRQPETCPAVFGICKLLLSSVMKSVVMIIHGDND